MRYLLLLTKLLLFRYSNAVFETGEYSLKLYNKLLIKNKDGGEYASSSENCQIPEYEEETPLDVELLKVDNQENWSNFLKT